MAFVQILMKSRIWYGKLWSDWMLLLTYTQLSSPNQQYDKYMKYNLIRNAHCLSAAVFYYSCYCYPWCLWNRICHNTRVKYNVNNWKQISVVVYVSQTHTISTVSSNLVATDFKYTLLLTDTIKRLRYDLKRRHSSKNLQFTNLLLYL